MTLFLQASGAAAESDRDARPLAGADPEAPPADLAASRYRVQTLRSVQEIEPFRAFWTACRPGRDCDLDFYLFVIEHIEGCRRPHVLVLFEDETPKALLAGRIDRVALPIKVGYITVVAPTMTVLRIVHGGFLGESTSQTARPLVSAMLDALRDGDADVAMLESADIRSPLFQTARALPSRFRLDGVIHSSVHRFRDMAEAVGPFLSQLTLRAPKRQRQRDSRLKRDFTDVAIKRLTSSDDLQELMSAAERITATSYQRGIGVGFARTPFVEARLAFEAQRGWLRAFVLYLDNQPCAFWIGSLRDGVFVSNYLAFDPHYEQYSPGMYLILNAIEAVLSEGSSVRLLDFGIGDADYKQQLSNKYQEEAPVLIFANRPKPLAVNALRSLVGAATHFVQSMEWLKPQVRNLKRWLRKQAAKGS